MEGLEANVEGSRANVEGSRPDAEGSRADVEGLARKSREVQVQGASLPIKTSRAWIFFFAWTSEPGAQTQGHVSTLRGRTMAWLPTRPFRCSCMCENVVGCRAIWAVAHAKGWHRDVAAHQLWLPSQQLHMAESVRQSPNKHVPSLHHQQHQINDRGHVDRVTG